MACDPYLFSATRLPGSHLSLGVTGVAMHWPVLAGCPVVGIAADGMDASGCCPPWLQWRAIKIEEISERAGERIAWLLHCCSMQRRRFASDCCRRVAMQAYWHWPRSPGPNSNNTAHHLGIQGRFFIWCKEKTASDSCSYGRENTWRVKTYCYSLLSRYTPSVSNYTSFDFFYLKFDNSSYSKICTKYHFFYCGLLYQYKIFINDLYLIIFAQNF